MGEDLSGNGRGQIIKLFEGLGSSPAETPDILAEVFHGFTLNMFVNFGIAI
jgi:hypothetical protein